MEKVFIIWICEFFKQNCLIDLDNYRDDQTRKYDIDSLLFLNWDLVSKEKKAVIKKFASKHNKRFVMNVIAPGLVCISEVIGNRRS